ncbi:hypothetical protein ACFZDK_54470 [Streptomyces sp. NPDC007901]|uniref:hypothetical protein n=1 Tax=Streptomyces sp. NPDC007901 TaxID=3364785 RepID=UPI0036E992C9
MQSRAAAEFLAAQYRDGTSLRIGVQALFEDVVWGEEERSDDAERAWQQLGLHLGFASTRPEKLYGTGPDNLWALSAARCHPGPLREAEGGRDELRDRAGQQPGPLGGRAGRP